MALRIVSADSHMIEPANLWVERIDKRFKERAPRSTTLEDRPGAFFLAEGLRPFPVAAVAATACGPARTAPAPVPAPDSLRIRQDIAYLASDRLEGRRAGPPGNDSAAA